MENKAKFIKDFIKLDESLLDRFLSARGINPKFVSTITKISHSKSGEFLKWKNDHANEEVEIKEGQLEKPKETGTAERKSAIQKSVSAHKEIGVPAGPGSHHSKMHGKGSQTSALTPEETQTEAFKMPPESLQDKMYRQHQELRKKSGLPHPDHYLKLAKQKQKEKTNEEVEHIDENFKPGDFVKDIVHGHIHRVHKVEGNNLVVNRHHGKDSYGTFTNIHKTKARKVETPTNEEVTSSTDKLKVDYSKVKGQSSNPSPSKLSSLPYEKLKKQGVTENFDKYAHDPEMHFVVRHQDKLSKDAESPKKMWTAISKHNSIGHAQDAHAKLKSDNPGENYTYTMHRRGLHEDNFADNKAPTQTVLSGAELSEKKAKSFKKLKEDLFDHEKEDKSVKTYGKKPKFDKADKKDSEGEKKPQAAATLTGGSTMTGEKRDVVEIDPMMRNRPGQPDVTKKDDKKDKKDDKTKEKK